MSANCTIHMWPILGLRPASERRRHFVTTSLSAGRKPKENQPWIMWSRIWPSLLLHIYRYLLDKKTVFECNNIVSNTEMVANFANMH